MDPFSTSALTIIASLIAILSSALAYAFKGWADSRSDLKDLTAKMMDRAIPALEQNATATIRMIEATDKALAVVAVAQADRDRERDRRP